MESSSPGLRRWIRLLFGREFGFDDLLLLWDSLFAEDPALDLVDMVCAAMLLRIRWQRKLEPRAQDPMLWRADPVHYSPRG
jgi:TBC1 domain family protein 5